MCRTSFTRINGVLLVSLGSFLAYLIICVSNVNPILRFIAAFPAVYLIPGLLCLLLRKPIGEGYDPKQLIVEGFFVSTVINVLIVASLVFFKVLDWENSFVAFYAVLVSILILANFLLHKDTRIGFTRLDHAVLWIVLTSFLVMAISFSILPRYFTPDETSYIADIRDIVSKGVVNSWSSSFSSGLASLVSGRIFWLLLGASFSISTGLQWYQLGLLGCMFLPMIALVSSFLIPSNFKDKGMLQIASVVLTLSSPLLVEFSGVILDDLGVTFFTLFAIALFIKSFKIDDMGNASLDIRGLVLCFLSSLIVILIKPNTLFLFPLCLIMIGFILKYRLYKVKIYRAILLGLTIPILAYEFIVDIPYVLVVWWNLGSEPVRHAIWAFARGFISLGSPAESFLGWFVQTPWKPTTIFSYDYFGYSNYLYRFLSPEVLGLLVAGIGLGLPAILLLKKIRSSVQMRLLALITSISLILFFLTFLSGVNFDDINRYCLFIYPLITVVSLVTFYIAFSESKVMILTALIIPSIILLQMNFSLTAENGGVYVGYGLSKINWTGDYLLFQLVVYSILVIMISKRTISLKLHKHTFTFHLPNARPKILFLSFAVLILLSNIYFSGFFLERSVYFTDVGLTNLNQPLGGTNTSFVLSNSFIYLRDFVNDNVYFNNYLFPPPMTQGELNDFVSKGFNGSKIVVTSDPRITGYEYANAYTSEFLQGAYIVPRSEPTEGIIPKPSNADRSCVLNIVPNANNSFDDLSDYGSNWTLHNTLSVKDEKGRNALLLNGHNSFVEFQPNSVLSIADALTVRIQFRTLTNQSGRFLLEKDNPYNYGIYLSANSTVLSFCVRLSKTGVVTADSHKIFSDNLLHDAVGVFDGRHVELYVDGLLEANTDIGTGDTIETSSQPLWIGTWAEDSFFNGTIYGAQIYNRALSPQEIQLPYLKGHPYAKPIYEENSQNEGKALVYQVEGPITLHENTSDISIKDVKVDTSNYSLSTLRMNAISPRSANLTIIVGTLRFLKILDARIEVGNNSLEYPFENTLPDGQSYGSYVSSRCTIIIIDEEGNVIYDNTLASFQVTGNWLLVYIGMLLSMLALYVVLSRRMAQQYHVRARDVFFKKGTENYSQ